MELTEEDRHNLAEIEHYKTYEWFAEAIRLDEGKSFGELAL